MEGASKFGAAAGWTLLQERQLPPSEAMVDSVMCGGGYPYVPIPIFLDRAPCGKHREYPVIPCIIDLSVVVNKNHSEYRRFLPVRLLTVPSDVRPAGDHGKYLPYILLLSE